MKRSIFSFISLLVLSITVLSACSPTPTAAPAKPTASQPPVVEATPTPQPTPTALPPSPTPTEEPLIPCNIAFDSDRDNNHEIYTMAPDGSNQLNLTNNPGDDTDPVWSPDGTRIAFVSSRDNENGDGRFIFIMQADGSGQTQISHQPDSQFPDWSPLGNQIAYNSQGEIFLLDLIDGREIQLTNSPEKDEQPKFSPDGQRIAWLKEEGGVFQVYIMNLDGSKSARLTNGGIVHGVEWSVDGRIFTAWEQPDGICFNCIVTADGTDIQDAGGKGTIQQFLPFWTLDGQRVEMGSGDINGTGHEDIFLVGENFPDLFLFLTSQVGNNRNPDTAFKCGPLRGNYPQYSQTPPATDPQPSRQSLVIGYTGSINPQNQLDIDTACTELAVQCVHGENITQLADLGVDAIVNSSNKWDATGSYPAVHDAVGRGIPVFMLNAEIHEKGVYNLSAEDEIYTTAWTWMFKTMGDQGEFVYYNFGDNGYIQNLLDQLLKEYPDITAIKKNADYNGNSFTPQDITEMIASNPNLKAIWSSEHMNDVFWGINNKSNSHLPLTECMARKDELIAWKNEIDAGSAFQGIAFIRPGGTAYEGIHVAYLFLNGSRFKADALVGVGSNTLRYDIPVITNETLPDWIGPKLDGLLVVDYGLLQLPPMTPEEIKAKWFD